MARSSVTTMANNVAPSMRAAAMIIEVRVAPAGPIYQAGTLSGNPMAMAAGTATLKLMTPAAYAAKYPSENWFMVWLLWCGVLAAGEGRSAVTRGACCARRPMAREHPGPRRCCVKS